MIILPIIGWLFIGFVHLMGLHARSDSWLGNEPDPMVAVCCVALWPIVTIHFIGVGLNFLARKCLK
jgi:hypothetical protein